MKNDMGKVLGISKGISKKTGNTFTKISIVGDYEDYEKNNNTVYGQQVTEVFINDDVEVNVNDEIELLFGSKVYDGKAQIKGVSIIG